MISVIIFYLLIGLVNGQTITYDICMYPAENDNITLTCNFTTDLCCNSIIYQFSECCLNVLGVGCDERGCSNIYSISRTPSATPLPSITPSHTPFFSISSFQSPTPSKIQDVIVIEGGLDISNETDYVVDQQIIVVGNMTMTEMTKMSIIIGEKNNKTWVRVEGSLIIAGDISLSLNDIPDNDDKITLFEAEEIDYQNYSLSIDTNDKNPCKKINSRQQEAEKSFSVLFSVDDNICNEDKKSNNNNDLIILIAVPVTFCICILITLTICIILISIFSCYRYSKIFNYISKEDKEFKSDLDRKKKQSRKEIKRNSSVSISQRHSEDF